MKKQPPLVFYAIICVITLFGLVSCADAHIAEAEQYVKLDTSVRKEVGDVMSSSSTKTTVVMAGTETRAYREYEFIVRGSRSKALVTVQILNIDSPSKRLLITSIDAL